MIVIQKIIIWEKIKIRLMTQVSRLMGKRATNSLCHSPKIKVTLSKLMSRHRLTARLAIFREILQRNDHSCKPYKKWILKVVNRIEI